MTPERHPTSLRGQKGVRGKKMVNQVEKENRKVMERARQQESKTVQGKEKDSKVI